MCRYGGKNVATNIGHIGCENDMQKITAYFLNGRMSSNFEIDSSTENQFSGCKQQTRNVE